jgi:hypothetical protein
MRERSAVGTGKVRFPCDADQAVQRGDHMTGVAAENTACFIDLVEASATYLGMSGEVGLGIGHHKASFSATKERIVISNIGD